MGIESNFSKGVGYKTSLGEVILGCDRKFNMACCKICSEIDGREKLLIPKFDHFRNM
jgi:hypothetical protein